MEDEDFGTLEDDSHDDGDILDSFYQALDEKNVSSYDSDSADKLFSEHQTDDLMHQLQMKIDNGKEFEATNSTRSADIESSITPNMERYKVDINGSGNKGKDISFEGCISCCLYDISAKS